MGIENIAATAFITPFLTAPSRGPIFHRGAPRYNWGATPVIGVHWAYHEIGPGASQPTRNAKFGRG